MDYIDVHYIGNSDALLTCYEKKGNLIPLLSCTAFVGKNGIHKQREGDLKTPSGEYSFLFSFGTGCRPETSIDYIQITKNHYWCSDDYEYNQLIDLSLHPHPCRGEHLIEYAEAYRYAIVLDYNKTGNPHRGSAIFLHCRVPGHYYTAGCIAISQKNMLIILKQCSKNTKIYIH
ncbi:MAG: L,D-transpeptidase family protein [Eubacterium sp.]|nr:L,D-transpeptidase family protein [Eubacterium sp.]MDD7208878.1 L,D-transpeptidase family protein [Lachnospiraceae bacterium]MDY5496458.1 L,D-transpeptidase family protein [Anaerobutyricum sp.]